MGSRRSHPEQWRYPWDGVFAVWGLLAILIGGLHVILRPGSFHHSWKRLLGALAYSAVLVVLGLGSVVTDMPGYYYVPAQFSVITMAGILIFAFVQVANTLWQCRRHASNDALPKDDRNAG